MFVKFVKNKKNSEPVDGLVTYLCKEDKLKKVNPIFYTSDSVTSADRFIADMNYKRGLKKTADKYFHLVISPSQKELENITDRQLVEYGREVMKAYAANFGKGYKAEDFVFGIKIEHDRSNNGEHRRYNPKKERKGLKSGDNRHIHILIRRVLKDKKRKASPMANAKSISAPNPIQCGFDRNSFKEQCENMFDLAFSYEREMEEKYDFMRYNWYRENAPEKMPEKYVEQIKHERKEPLHTRKDYLRSLEHLVSFFYPYEQNLIYDYFSEKTNHEKRINDEIMNELETFIKFAIDERTDEVMAYISNNNELRR